MKLLKPRQEMNRRHMLARAAKKHANREERQARPLTELTKPLSDDDKMRLQLAAMEKIGPVSSQRQRW